MATKGAVRIIIYASGVVVRIETVCDVVGKDPANSGCFSTKQSLPGLSRTGECPASGVT